MHNYVFPTKIIQHINKNNLVFKKGQVSAPPFAYPGQVTMSKILIIIVINLSYKTDSASTI